ncbi:MAG TPA: adenosylmethionine decarboxylase [Rhodocyclaceae bacterium]|nr:adenosylmethionine decarboxylase [Rhodocyclaceae bacterium]
MNGLHLIADLHACDCAPGLLLDAARLETLCADACARHGLTIVGRFFHQFTNAAGAPSGVTGTVVLAESHLAIHTWPEISGVTLDVYVCNFSADNSAAARSVFREMMSTFMPGRAETKEVVRGHLAGPITST